MTLQILEKIIISILIVVLVELLMLGMLLSNNQKPTGRFYHDMDYSKDRYIDYWNDMWAECEFGEKNYEAVRKEYGIE